MHYKITVFFVGFLLVMSACERPPTLPVVPRISFDRVEFYEGVGNSDFDTLSLTIQLQDGDGDLGLDDRVTGFPFDQQFYYFNPNNGNTLEGPGEFITPNADLSNVIVYGYLENGEIVKDPNIIADTLPDPDPVFDCFYGQFQKASDTTDTRTYFVYRQINPNQFNFHVKYFIVRGDQEIPFEASDCVGFNGRFPVLKDLNETGPVEGELRYKMTSFSFRNLFRNDSIKIRFFIYDRTLEEPVTDPPALQSSNVEFTTLFTLDQIKVN